MKKTVLLGIMSLLLASTAYAQSSGNNSVYIDQTNADNSVTLITQTGSGNTIGDRNDMITPAFAIEGNSMILTISQDGMNNQIIGNFIGGDSTATITQTGNTNYHKNNQGNFGTNSGVLTATQVGDNNNTEMNFATTNNAGNYNYMLLVTGSYNNVTSTMNSKYIVNNISITGDYNNFTTTQIGANGTSNTPGHQITSTIIGSNNAVVITQNGTTTPNMVTLNVTGSNTSTTITQH
jgi:hypothetical protein